MKKVKIVIRYTLGSLAIVYGLIVLFPQVLFSNSIDYKNFSVYYHSNNIDISKMESVLDKSAKLLSESDIYNAEKKQKIFLCTNFEEFTFFALRSRKSFAVNYPLIQNIFLSQSDISENTIQRNASENNLRTLSGVIAHETTHSLLEDKLGILKYKLLPSWKNEGYCDYVSKESSYDEELGWNQICQNNKEDTSPSYRYFKYQTYVQFLLQEEKHSIDAFLKQGFNIEAVAFKSRKKYCQSLENKVRK